MARLGGRSAGAGDKLRAELDGIFSGDVIHEHAIDGFGVGGTRRLRTWSVR